MRWAAAAAVAAQIAAAGPLPAQEIDTAAEIRYATEAIERGHGSLGGMGGLGTIPEDDLQTIQGILGEAERLLREARLRAQARDGTPQSAAWIAAYARAAQAMAETADGYRRARGYQ